MKIFHNKKMTMRLIFFFKKYRSEVALVYNDRAVLENYHISASFKLMLNDSCNILQELTRDEFK